MNWAASVERQLLLKLEWAVCNTQCNTSVLTQDAVDALLEFRRDQAKAEADKTEAGGFEGATVANKTLADAVLPTELENDMSEIHNGLRPERGDQ